MAKDDPEFFDDAKHFWEWVTNQNGEKENGESPFFNEGDFLPDDVDFGDMNMNDVIDRDAEHEGGELAFSGYEISQIQDAINYVNDAPPGILRIWIEGDEIEIYRYPSGVED